MAEYYCKDYLNDDNYEAVVVEAMKELQPFIDRAYAAGQKNPVERIVGIDGYFEVPDRPVAPHRDLSLHIKALGYECDQFHQQVLDDMKERINTPPPVAPVEDNPIPKCKVCGEPAKYDSRYCDKHSFCSASTNRDIAPPPAEQMAKPIPGTKNGVEFPPPQPRSALEEKKAVLAMPIEERRKVLEEQAERATQPRTAEEVAREIKDKCIDVFDEGPITIEDVGTRMDNRQVNVQRTASLITAYGDERVKKELWGMRINIESINRFEGQKREEYAALTAENERLTGALLKAATKRDDYYKQLVDAGNMIASLEHKLVGKDNLVDETVALRTENEMLTKERDALKGAYEAMKTGELQADNARLQTRVKALENWCSTAVSHGVSTEGLKVLSQILNHVRE
jgi:hypothetical protein